MSRRAALLALTAVEKGRSSRIEAALRLDALGPLDRALAFELAQGTERQHLFLDTVLSAFVSRGLPGDPLLLSALRLGAYQLLFASRMPARAVVHETVGLVRHNAGFVNAALRALSRHIQPRAARPDLPRREIPLPEGPAGDRSLVLENDLLPALGTPGFLAARYGLPAFLVARLVDAHGFAATEMIATAAGLPPQLVLRPTARRPDDVDLTVALAAEGVSVVPAGLHGMLLVESGSPFETKVHAQGWIIAQDPTAYAAAAAVCEAMGERAGAKVLDLCAAPGTKTTVLAEQVGPGGRVFAYDIDPRRRLRIVENVTRLHLAERVTVLEDLEDLERHGRPAVDAVLVDAPCSNTGVLGRRVEVRRRLDPTAIQGLAVRQRQLLLQGMARCRPGGIVVYSTCSIDPEENQRLVAAVLAGCPAVRLVREEETLPEPLGPDGGYFAVLAMPAADPVRDPA